VAPIVYILKLHIQVEATTLDASKKLFVKVIPKIEVCMMLLVMLLLMLIW